MFPHVVAGTVGEAYAESVLLISNPSDKEVVLEISGSQGLGFADQTVTLAPFEARQVRVGGGDYRAGFLVVSSPDSFASDVQVVTKPSEDSEAVWSRIAIPGQVPTTKIAFPVLIHSALADDTGFAITTHNEIILPAQLSFALYNPNGEVVASTQRPSAQYLALFVTELFPDLPPDFTTGWLVIQSTEDPVRRRAMALAGIALYTYAERLFSVATTSIDTGGSYSVTLKGADDANFQAIVDSYGLTAVSHHAGFPDFSAVMTREIARALARDPRVQSVSVNHVVFPQ